MAVDWEQRIDFERLRTERLGARQEAAEGVGDRRAALLRHEQHPLHHRDAHRHLGDGQARAVHPAAAGRRADPVGLRLRRPPPPALLPLARRALARGHLDRCAARWRPRWAAPKTWRARFASSSRSAGCMGPPLGVDVIELPVLFALQREGIQVVDGQQLMQQARMIKTAGRDHAAQHRLHDGGRRLRRAVPLHEARRARERVRRPGQQGALRYGVGARRGRQRHLRRALQPAPARLQRPRAAPRRPGLLRHPAQLQRLPHLLLPHVRHRQRVRSAGGRLQALPRLPRRRDRA